MSSKCLRLWLLLCYAASPVAANDIPGELYELGEFARFEASGVAYVDGRLVVVDDTLNALFLFDTRGVPLGTLDSVRMPAARAKFEDLTYDAGTGTLFAVGSHEGWTEDTLRSMSVLVELRLDDTSSIDDGSVRQLPLWSGFAALGLWRPRGMKIEGLAVAPSGDTLFVGLREPVDRARIYVASVESLRAGKPNVSVLREFDAGAVDGTPYCISALTFDATGGGLLVATSTEDRDTHRFLGNRLWRVSLDATERAEVTLLWDGFDVGMKAEGLAVGAESLFVVYDNDQDDTGIPSHLRVVPLASMRAATRGD